MILDPNTPSIAKVMDSIAVWEEKDGEVLCDEMLSLIGTLPKDDSIGPQDLGKIIAFAADQGGRWRARWLFSPLRQPDNIAEL